MLVGALDMVSSPPPVRAELFRLLYRHIPAVLTANLINSVLVVVALWDVATRRNLVGWAAVIAAVTLVRVVLWLRCREAARSDAEVLRWGRGYTVGVLISGLLWGCAAFLFISMDDRLSLLVMSFIIGGMGAGAVASLSAHLPTFHAFLLGSMVPFELRLLTLGDPISLALSGMVAIYVISMIVIAHNVNAALIRSLVLNEENKRLLATRDQEVLLRTADLRAANAELEREIGERARTEDKLEEARAEAERANQAKSRFLAAAAHDLRQPLQSMFLFASSLHRFVADPKGVDALVRIERGLDILKGMLDGLLDLSRLDVKLIEPTIAAFPLRPMLDDIVVAYRRIAASKGIDLRCGASGQLVVRSDKTMLGRMVRNLVENALRYTERGRIVLSTRTEGDTVLIEVEDTGIGIAPDHLKLIFEEFHQVGNPERDKARGLGLGLAIVQRLSAVLDHPVEVRSRPGVGSTFSIAVPLAAEAIVAAEPPVEIPPLEGSRGRQVVVVDDDPMVLLALSTLLEQWGYRVIMAGSKDDALGQLRSRAPPHLIVADYRLRNGLVGTDAIRGIRACCGDDIPGVVLTGETGDACLKDAESLGALVLHKPVTPHDLAFVLKRLIGEDEDTKIE
ncbi:MAG: response regulator [Alphaproteobacteria bacterium]|nr:response regulator [Alphaproteobacteria bacterium]